jgi:hypothetical protein
MSRASIVSLATVLAVEVDAMPLKIISVGHVLSGSGPVHGPGTSGLSVADGFTGIVASANVDSEGSAKGIARASRINYIGFVSWVFVILAANLAGASVMRSCHYDILYSGFLAKDIRQLTNVLCIPVVMRCQLPRFPLIWYQEIYSTQVEAVGLVMVIQWRCRIENCQSAASPRQANGLRNGFRLHLKSHQQDVRVRDEGLVAAYVGGINSYSAFILPANECSSACWVAEDNGDRCGFVRRSLEPSGVDSPAGQKMSDFSPETVLPYRPDYSYIRA